MQVCGPQFEIRHRQCISVQRCNTPLQTHQDLMVLNSNVEGVEHIGCNVPVDCIDWDI
jgi:hypothetical protein